MMEVIGYIVSGILAALIGFGGFLHFWAQAMRPNGDGNGWPGAIAMLFAVVVIGAMIWNTIGTIFKLIWSAVT